MENNPQTQAGNTVQTDNGKTVAIISYLSIIGWVIALVMHNGNKTPLGAYHLRQTIPLYIAGIVVWILQLFIVLLPYIGFAIDTLLTFVYIALAILWLIGFIAAINGQEKPIPLIGKKSQEWFHGLA